MSRSIRDPTAAPFDCDFDFCVTAAGDFAAADGFCAADVAFRGGGEGFAAVAPFGAGALLFGCGSGDGLLLSSDGDGERLRPVRFGDGDWSESE